MNTRHTTFTDACDQNTLAKLTDRTQQNVEVVMNRQIYTKIDDVISVARQGDFVGIHTTEEGMGGTVGTLREADVQSWWSFLPELDIRKQCESR